MTIIFEGTYGSHLFGLASEKSDLDIKAVYVPELIEVIKGTYRRTLNESNKEDPTKKSSRGTIEKEVMSLQFFIEKMLEGQIVHIDMLFIPDAKTIHKDAIWQNIIDNRERALSKNIVNAFRGFIYTQIDKYAKRVDKVKQAEEIVNILEQYPESMLFSDIFSKNEAFFMENPNIELSNHDGIKCIVFMGKKYLFNAQNKNILNSLNQYLGKYGGRVLELKKNENIDWKSLSHAFRGTYQLKHLALSGEYSYPLPEKDYLLQIKNGELDYNQLIDELIKELGQTLEIAEASPYLPDEPDHAFWNNFLLQVYIDIINPNNNISRSTN